MGNNVCKEFKIPFSELQNLRRNFISHLAINRFVSAIPKKQRHSLITSGEIVRKKFHQRPFILFTGPIFRYSALKGSVEWRLSVVIIASKQSGSDKINTKISNRINPLQGMSFRANNITVLVWSVSVDQLISFLPVC